jgi:preprotein translocase subunit SecG
MIIRDDEYLDFSKVPESRGVPNFLYRVVAVGVLMIFAIGAAVCLMSSYGHMWPADKTLRAPLEPTSP